MPSPLTCPYMRPALCLDAQQPSPIPLPKLGLKSSRHKGSTIFNTSPSWIVDNAMIIYIIFMTTVTGMFDIVRVLSRFSVAIAASISLADSDRLTQGPDGERKCASNCCKDHVSGNGDMVIRSRRLDSYPKDNNVLALDIPVQYQANWVCYCTGISTCALSLVGASCFSFLCTALQIEAFVQRDWHGPCARGWVTERG